MHGTQFFHFLSMIHIIFFVCTTCSKLRKRNCLNPKLIPDKSVTYQITSSAHKDLYFVYYSIITTIRTKRVSSNEKAQ